MDPVQENICETQGQFFELAARTLNADSFPPFVNLYMQSEFCRWQMDTSYSRYQFAAPTECLDNILLEINKNKTLHFAVKGEKIFSPDVAYWAGYVYRQLFFRTGWNSPEILQKFPFSQMVSSYSGLHTVDDEMAVDMLLESLEEKNLAIGY